MGQSYFIRQMRAQQKWRLEDSINLLPSENVTSPQVRALLSSDFGHRYTLPINAEYSGEFLENCYRGTRITTEIEAAAEKLACEVFQARHACVQPLSGHIAAMIAIVSVTKRGGRICSIPVKFGGYDGYEQPYIPDMLGLKASSLSFDVDNFTVNAVRASDQIRKSKPNLVILGASFIPFPYEMGPIRDACEDVESVLAYDGSHVLGLIAGGAFQRPLEEGARILYGSTHKSFFGPQGGLIVTSDDRIGNSVKENLTWRVVDNVHWNRVAALGQALFESKKFGRQYAKQVVKNSKTLGSELSQRGFPLMFEGLGFTESHQLIIDQKGIASKYGMTMNDFSVRLERSNLITDSVGRLGTSEITRMGMKEKDIPELADLFAEAAEGRTVRKKVRDLRGRFDMDYTLQ